MLGACCCSQVRRHLHRSPLRSARLPPPQRRDPRAGEAMLEEGRGAGSLCATQASLSRITGVGREGSSACRVVDAQVVLVPVAAVLA